MHDDGVVLVDVCRSAHLEKVGRALSGVLAQSLADALLTAEGTLTLLGACGSLGPRAEQSAESVSLLGGFLGTCLPSDRWFGGQCRLSVDLFLVELTLLQVVEGGEAGLFGQECLIFALFQPRDLLPGTLVDHRFQHAHFLGEH